MAIKVKLREKQILGDRKSLYLDFYPAIPHPKTGKPTRREFLGLYLYNNPITDYEKNFNKENFNCAEQIRANREDVVNINYRSVRDLHYENLSKSTESQKSELISKIRTAFADYVKSEGCGCCGSKDAHDEASERLGKLLDVEKYSDGSGFNFYAYATNKKSKS